MKTKLISLMIALMFGMFVVSSFAQDDEGEDFRPIHPRMGFKHIPDLTADQISQIQKLRLTHQKDVLPIRTKLQSARLGLKSMILEDANASKIEQQVEQIGKIRTELMKKRVKHQLSVRNLLTDEQKVFFDAKGLQHHGRFKGEPRPQRGLMKPGFRHQPRKW